MAPSGPQAFPDRVYGLLVEDEDARVCRDIPDSACNEQPRAFLLQWLAQTLTKIGDTLTSSRLVLAWMLAALGTPPFFVALLVPVRESLSLLPQLFVAQWVREHALRKFFWVWGSVAQGLALLGMMVAVLLLEGASLGWAVVVLLACFSLARGVCSIAAKDVLGKTVSKSRRGRLTGLAAAAAGAIVLLLALALLVFPDYIDSQGNAGAGLFAGILAAAACLWFLAAAVYAGVPELPGATSGGGNAFAEALRSLTLLYTDVQLRRFVIARALLVSTAFAIPYLVVLVQRAAETQILSFAALLVAEGAAALLSAAFWGRWSDSGAHHVMAAAAALATLAVAVAVTLQLVNPAILGHGLMGAVLVFTAAVAHQGARVGRKTYLVDMASGENRAQYTAVSNTAMGVLLFAGVGLGVIEAACSIVAVLALLMAAGILATYRCLRLPSVSGCIPPC